MFWYEPYRVGMRSFVDVLSFWPSLTALASDLGVPYGVVKQWRRRNSIPADKWQALISAASERGYVGITADRLAALAADREAA